MMQEEVKRHRVASETAAAQSHVNTSPSTRSLRHPATTLRGCRRVLILGKTGSGKTTLARELSAVLKVPHVELDALYFGPNFSTTPLGLLRERTSAAIAGDRWVTDGNKSAVRDVVWPRADTVIWLDYPWVVCIWRLGKRAIGRASVLKSEAAQGNGNFGFALQLITGAKAVLRALRSHMGQRHEYPRMFALPENQHFAVVRLRSPRATRRWLVRAVDGDPGRDAEV